MQSRTPRHHCNPVAEGQDLVCVFTQCPGQPESVIHAGEEQLPQRSREMGKRDRQRDGQDRWVWKDEQETHHGKEARLGGGELSEPSEQYRLEPRGRE